MEAPAVDTDAPFLNYPQGLGHFAFSDGRKQDFIMHHVDLYPSYGVIAGRRRTLRDRLPDSSPGEVRRLTVIEQVTKVMPDLAGIVRRKLSNVETDLPTWLPFTLKGVEVSVISVGADRTHIKVVFRATAGTDVMTVTTRDPIH